MRRRERLEKRRNDTQPDMNNVPRGRARRMGVMHSMHYEWSIGSIENTPENRMLSRYTYRLE